MFNLFQQKQDPADFADKKLKVNLTRCPQSHACPSVRVCPAGALKQKGSHAPYVDETMCIKCGKCVKFCPMHALSIE